jgi:hypothetical protein
MFSYTHRERERERRDLANGSSVVASAGSDVCFFAGTQMQQHSLTGEKNYNKPRKKKRLKKS